MSKRDQFGVQPDIHARKQRTLHYLFEQYAREDPDRPAVLGGGKVRSYGEVNRVANQLARRLQELGVRLGTMVGISVDRSPEGLVGLLAILKAGGAYVPLDPELPSARLTHIIEDTSTEVIVCSRRTAELLPDHDASVIFLEEREEIDLYPSHDLTGSVSADDLAYVIYTSGSTGRPKGVLVTHDNVVNLVTDQTYVSVGEGDRVAALATLAFDASVFELWAPLTNGATCVLYESEFNGDLAGLVERVRADGVTILHLTSPVFRLLKPADFASLGRVHTILFGGDSVRFEFGVRAQASFGGRLIHLYGPTETTGFATFFDVATMSGTAVNIPIGQPIRNVHVRVVDEAGCPVPEGQVGELLIGGCGVARGYLNRDDATAERFIADPDGSPNARRYRTGDLVKTIGTNTIQFLGRLDRQVKVRGYRIEPGEVEHALAAHPLVRDAVVLAREDGTGDKRLDGYVVPAGPLSAEDHQRLVAEVRVHASAVLASHQQPRTLTVIEEIPLTDNLKIDEARLPVPIAKRDESSGHSDASGDLRQLLEGLWADFFGVDEVDIDDNFFELGGDSLMAWQTAATVEKAVGRPYTVTDLLKSPTIRQLLHDARAE